MADHEQFIDEALELAERGRGWVSPNPMVGALVVKNGQVIGRGWHKQFGGPHAEIFALQEAGAQAKGATLYCTLEPCNHTGKTPPCVQAILTAGISTVVLGVRDPNPVAGGGLDALKSAGILIVSGIREPECRRLNAAFFKHTLTGLPFVTLKWAMSADGKLAASSGDSKWITGEAAREYAHGLRARHDAVLIGIGTLLADDSKLNCRGTHSEKARQPRRVILDSAARLPLESAIWSAGGGAITVVCNRSAPAHRVEALAAKDAEVIQLEASGALPLRETLLELARRGVLSVLVEGGSKVLGSFLDARLADKAYIFVAPKLIGGNAAPSPVGGHGAAKVRDGLELHSPSIQLFGNDVLMSGTLSEWA